ncbi:MAG: CsgG/HfaB family protein [Thermoanaerobaculia bacterium]|nr:CsgG/HfaB family protein [Thermoanaerobaculia bacterium]
MLRRTLFCFLAAAVVLAAAPLVAQEGGLRYTVTVTKFDNQAGWSGQWDIGDAWATVMTDILNQTGQFIVLGETDMRDEAMIEQDLGASGRTAQGGKTAQTGQLTPAQLLVKGAITHVEGPTQGGSGGIRVRGFRVGGGGSKAEVNATIYMVDSTTGQVVASTSVVGTSKKRSGRFGYSGAGWGGDIGGFKNDNTGKAVEDAVSQAVDWMVEQLPSVTWSGTVVMTQGDQVYVNRGSREGLSSGTTLSVGESMVIRDPDTGEVLDESVKEVAQIRCDTIKEKLSICSVVSGNAGAIQKGMRVQP